MTLLIWRVQDAEGRGPFRPGFTKTWKTDHGLNLPPIFVELNIAPEQLPALCPRGMHVGIGCDSWLQLMKWFSHRELETLAKAGFGVVNFEPKRIIARTRTQVLFAHDLPLRSIAYASHALGQAV